MLLVQPTSRALSLAAGRSRCRARWSPV